jgi:hypothetical protein
MSLEVQLQAFMDLKVRKTWWQESDLDYSSLGFEILVHAKFQLFAPRLQKEIGCIEVVRLSCGTFKYFKVGRTFKG